MLFDLVTKASHGGTVDQGAIVLAIISSSALAAFITGAVTWMVQSRSLKHSQLVESARLLSDLQALAHSRDPTGRRTAIGSSETVGSIEMVAALGVNYQPLRIACASFLDSHIASYGPLGPSPSPEVHDAAVRARGRITL
jgi:hypothetical protein